MASRAGSLESRLFHQYWDDGLLDLLGGLGVIGISIFWAFDLVAVGAVVPAILASLWVPLRRALVEPRAGLVEFSDARSGRTRRMTMTSLWLGVAMLAVFVAIYLFLPRPEGLVRLLVPGLPAFLLGLLAVVAGLGLGLPRFLVYAGLLGVCGVGVALADTRPEIGMLVGGVVMTGTGTYLLSRLLRLEVESGEEG